MKRATNILTIRSYGASFEDKKESYEKEVKRGGGKIIMLEKKNKDIRLKG